MKKKILLFLKGMLMGICDLIPGVSGGTIAFITGIYIRLINAVKGFSPKILFDFIMNRGELKKDIKRLDLGFLSILLLGISTSVFLGSGIIKFLLENYFIYSLSFFIGLILASSKIIFDDIKNHNFKNSLFGFIGFFIGILIALLNPSIIHPSLIYVFIGGFVGISALFLPGISGAFILLIMGLYEFMINVLHDLFNNLNYFLVFILGAGLGAFSISRLISFLFKKDKCKTLYFLLGLVIGSLSIPLRTLLEISSLKISNIFIMVLYFLLGVFIVIFSDHKMKQKLINIEN